MFTAYHAKYYAHLLTARLPADSADKFGASLMSASVDLNPHQIDAALFAFRSPLSRGAVLADEVGLGKTIEAALVISQLWAERRRRILIVVPPTLRKQWVEELSTKFGIPATVIQSWPPPESRDAPVANQVLVASYHLARANAAFLNAVPWDLVVIDEAHRLRNVYRTDSKISRAIRSAFEGKPKILLTATPLQNSILELFGLITFIDPHLFGHLDAFRAQYARMDEAAFADLRRRIEPVCTRTLRRQVVEYVRYTKRIPMTQDFTPTPEEQDLYDRVSEYLTRQKLHALPDRQRKLITLVLRKLLASSSYAISGTLETMLERLEGKRTEQGTIDQIAENFESLPEMTEELEDSEQDAEAPSEPTGQKDLRSSLEVEIDDLRSFRALAVKINQNAKGDALLAALKAGFVKLEELGAQRKAVVFTESRRTQEYLLALLEANGYSGQVVALNGSNADARSNEIYGAWKKEFAQTERVTGSKAVDIRAALIDHFRDRASILVATEAAAEGVNLQFCSLVVNYDLPWNPQRIEQRIGRCHRYGQQHDVVVINFLNRKNAADARVFQLLLQKFQLFDGVFGASDDILGSIGSGIDFEMRIASIYQSCRTAEEIDAAFDALQKDLEDQIAVRMAGTRDKLLENFDEDVHKRLRLSLAQTQGQLDRLSQALWGVSQFELGDQATFDEATRTFSVPEALPGLPATAGTFTLRTDRSSPATSSFFGPRHILAEALTNRSFERTLPLRQIVFDYSRRPTRSAPVEALLGKAGLLQLWRVTINALETEDYLLSACVNDDGEALDAEAVEKLLFTPGEASECSPLSDADTARLQSRKAEELGRLFAGAEKRNRQFFDDEMEKLERWADDLKLALEYEIKELDIAIREAKREARLETGLAAKVEKHRKQKALEAQRAEKRRALFEAQDEVDGKKETLLVEIEARLKQQVTEVPLFTIRWGVA
ncbi:MAG: DEAD/DEAH box helicase [Vicinamibacteria bacterium]|nr:DEAD/DEAH box helicase [Vicinamibacteria bacterium]